MTLSSQPFRSPKPKISENVGEWRSMGLLSEVMDSVEKGMDFKTPSTIQRIAIPQIMSGGNIVVAAVTGSGKTLSYVLPVVNALKAQETVSDQIIIRKPGRPRAIILVPTRELASQVLKVIKTVSHYAKVSSCGIFGGEDYGKQKRELMTSKDIIVGSPGRLLKHRDEGTLFLSQVTHVVIDEVDTMLTQGFGPDIKALTRQLIKKQDQTQFVMVSATVTTALKKLLNEGEFPKIRMVETRDVHQSLPNMKHSMIDCKGRDKISVLLEILSQIRGKNSKGSRTLIFCNTVSSAQALEHSLRESEITSLCYHGEIPSADRSKLLARFKDGNPSVLVATDVAARGLDMPEVDHVIMFDFPLNSIDYLHRSGRTSRMGKEGRVTSLLRKRDLVLASAIEKAIVKGEPLDALSARKSDYLPGGKLSNKPKKAIRENRHSKKKTNPQKEGKLQFKEDRKVKKTRQFTRA